MSRSRKKNPAGGIAIARSDKQDKVMAHRAERARVRRALAYVEEPITRKKAGNVWKFEKDGHAWYGDDAVRRDPDLIRK